MRKGIKNFCNGHGSTSTLDQRRPFFDAATTPPPQTLPTLEDMIMRLEIEEGNAAARRSKLEDHEEEDFYCGEILRRRSCVDSSDRILRSAKDALNQYPRFSLDGKDAMCRSSFAPRRTSTTCDGCDDEIRWRRRRRRRRRSDGCGDSLDDDDEDEDLEIKKKLITRPRTLAGEAVEWCKPGVVAKLMGLEAVPVPLRKRHHNNKGRRAETRELRQSSRTRCRAAGSGFKPSSGMEGGVLGLGSGSGCGPRYCVARPISVENHINGPCSTTRPLP